MRSKIVVTALVACLFACDVFTPTVSAQWGFGYGGLGRGYRSYYGGYGVYSTGYVSPYLSTYSYNYRPYYAGYVAPLGYTPYYGGYSPGYALPYSYAAPAVYGSYSYGYLPYGGRVYYGR